MAKFSLIFLLVAILKSVLCSNYIIFNIGKGCGTGQKLEINMKSLESNSSGILKASEDGNVTNGVHCEVVLTPPLGYGTIISVREIQIPKNDSSSSVFCDDSYLEIFKSANDSDRLCGYSFDSVEFQFYKSDGPARLNFHVTNETGSNVQFPKFEITFTAARKANGWCKNEEFLCKNDRCIWRGLRMDGRNNCGDLSDEIPTSPKYGGLSLNERIAVVGATILTCVALVSVIVYVKRKHSSDFRRLTVNVEKSPINCDTKPRY